MHESRPARDARLGQGLWSLFFARAKKRDLPWVSHPQIAYETARLARDTIYTLDPGLRRDDEQKTLVT
jgi:hypothetical protein